MDLDSRAQRAAMRVAEGDLPAAVDEYERLLAEIDAGKRHYAEATWRSDFARVLNRIGDPREAAQLTKAVALFQKEGDAHRLADACLRLSRFHLGSAAAAMYWIDRAVAAAEKGGDDADLSQTLACRGELLMAAGRSDEALAALERAVQLQGGSVYADILASAQIAAGKSREGLDTLTSALADAEHRGGAGSANRVVTLSIRLADAHRALGDPRAASALLESVAVHAESLAEDHAFGALMDRLGVARLENGDAAGAVAALERGLDRLRDRGGPEALETASMYNNLGNALVTLGNHRGAVRAFGEAVRLAAGTNPASEAIYTFGLANAAAKARLAAEARNAYEEARGLAVRMQNRKLEAACLDSLGTLYTRTGEPAKAIDLHRRAAQLHAADGDHQSEHTDLLNLIQPQLLLGEVAAARRTLDAARGVATAHLERVPWQHALMEGQVLAREDRWQDAREAFEAAIAQLESERATLATPQDQRRWAADRVEGFHIATAAAFRARDARSALAFMEGNRARFLEAVSERRRRLPPGLSAEARAAYTAAVDRLAELRWRRREHPAAVDAQLTADLADAERAWRERDAEVESLRSREAAPQEPAPALEDLATTLARGEAVVALHVDEEWLGAACVGRDANGDLWWDCATDPGFDLAALSRLVVGSAEGDAVSERRSWQDLTTLSPAEAGELVAKVSRSVGPALWPLVERVVRDRAETLVLMPGRGLNVLPLHAMATSDGRLVMDRWVVRYAPSLRLYDSAARAASPASACTLGQVVNPTGDLPFAATEAATVRALWQGARRDPLAGADASPDRVLALLGNVDVLHFAGHGAFDPDDPLQSRLVCAPGGANGALTLQSVLDCVAGARARVVLLSACETGRVVAGDPLNDQLGLPGGLLVAGSTAILATFWPVDDLAACLVLSRCIDSWQRQGCDLAQALAEAQGWLREKVTVGVALDWIATRLDRGDAPSEPLELAYGRLSVRDEHERLFASEIHWAPFHVSGRAVRLG
jgi:CHAT domain-containing protein/tetratricopeptide (TPR) repeat protein